MCSLMVCCSYFKYSEWIYIKGNMDTITGIVKAKSLSTNQVSIVLDCQVR